MVQDWEATLALGERLGVVSAEGAARARERLAERSEATVAQVAEWAGVRQEDLERLAGALDLATRSGGTAAVAGAPLATRRLRDGNPSPDAPTAPTASSARPLPDVPRTLGPYELLEPLGHGGMGVVFRARHERLGHLCAVKVLIAGEFASDEAIARFQREAASVARMGKHPNIVTVHDLGREGGLVWYAMELVEGNSMRVALTQRDVPPEEAARWVEKIARAVHFAHTKGVIHRDLKPENVVIDPGGEPQVMDFGLALDVSTSARLSVTGDVFGSPNYMAPEQARGEVEKCDARTDVYGLGGILYEALTRIPPHPGRRVAEVLDAVLRGEVLAPRRVRPDVPRDLDTVCMKCLEPEQGRRYGSAEDLADDLARFLRGELVQARPIGRMGRLVRRVRRHPLVSGLVAGLALFALGMGWRLLGPAPLSIAVLPPDATLEVSGTTLWWNRYVWPARPFRLRIEAVDCLPEEMEVQASPGTMIDLGVVRLQSAYGDLFLSTKPDGAEILYRDRSYGFTRGPTLIRLPVGDLRVVLRLKDYIDESRLVTIHPGQPTIFGTVQLAHEQGTLRLDGCPRGVEATITSAKGEVVARLSPPAIAHLDTGSYTLEARLEDHFEKRSSIRIAAGPATNANVSVGRQLLWKCEMSSGVSSAPALADFDCDGVLDCVIGTWDGTVCALSGRDGAALWRFKVGGELWDHKGGVAIVSTPALGDVNGDGVLDCVVGSQDKTVYALSGRDGAVLWTCATDEAVHQPLALADLNGDGVLDCVVPTSKETVRALSGKDASVLWSATMSGAQNLCPTLADLNGDGVPDGIVGSSDKSAYALSGRDGSVLWRASLGDVVGSPSGLADMNGDASPDCIVAAKDGMVHALSGKDGAVLWSHDTKAEGHSRAALGDVNGDGVLDCVVSSERTIFALSTKDGSVLWSRETGRGRWGVPALGDLDGDGAQECVVWSDDRLSALEGKAGALLWSYGTGYDSLSYAALGDVNGDGVRDCVGVSNEGRVWALSGGDGSSPWSREVALPAPPSEPVLELGDLDGDGVLDSILGAEDGTVDALTGRDGALLWSYPACRRCFPALADVNGDGVCDCVVAGENFDWALDRVVRAVVPEELDPPRGRVRALSGKNGSVLWDHPMSAPVGACPAFGDVNGDGRLDCVVVSGDRSLEVSALSGRDGSKLWSRNLRDGVCCRASLGDLNGDGLADCVVAAGKEVDALSGKDGFVLWSAETGSVDRSIALGDLNGDGVLDCVGGSDAKGVFALSGRDGSTLWSRLVGDNLWSSVALGDMDGDRIPDCAVAARSGSRFGRNLGIVCALSGRDGSVLWRQELGGPVWLSASLGDVNGDEVPDSVVGSWDHAVCALSGRDGAVLWRYVTGAQVSCRPVLGDLNEDGIIDCVVGSEDHRLYAILGRDVEKAVDPVTRLHELRCGRWWPSLREFATRRLRIESAPWLVAVTHSHLGIAETWLGRTEEALAAFAEARRRSLRAPDAAVYEWVASRLSKECPPERRTQADEILLDALAFEPDIVFDTIVECRELLARVDPSDLRAVLDRAASMDSCAIERPLLLALPMPDGSRPNAGNAGPGDLLDAPRALVLARIEKAEGSAARNLGYLALIADALGEGEVLARTYGTYRALPRRPPSLDVLLSEAAGRK